jgi:hypothetical protein
LSAYATSSAHPALEFRGPKTAGVALLLVVDYPRHDGDA